MKKIILNSYAKLNLYLAVLDKRKDNYHTIETIFERIDLCDKITLESRKDKKITVSCNSPFIPQNGSNLAYKAAQLLQKDWNIDKGVDIKIIKRIPVGSGMGGGSSNAAAVLRGLNKLWSLNLNISKLDNYAKEIGADVSFFIYNIPFALGRQRGDSITQIHTLGKRRFWHILVVPRIKVSTPLIYKKWDEYSEVPSERLTIPQYDVKLLISAIEKNNLFLLSSVIFNSLEQITTKVYPQIRRIKEKFIQIGLKSFLMSGSGPTMFGFVSSRKEALSLQERLKKNRSWQVFVTHTV